MVSKEYKGKFMKEFTEISIDKRIDESNRIRKKYPDRVPVIIDKGSHTTPDIDRHKYLVPKDLTMMEFCSLIRGKIKLDKGQGLYLFVGDSQVLPKMSETMGSIDLRHKDHSGYLPIVYTLENTFGAEV
jgi:GABA(A) receptor-associated protein